MGRPDVTIMAYQGGNRATLRTRIGTFGEYTPGTNVTTDFASAKLSARRSILEGGGVASLVAEHGQEWMDQNRGRPVGL